MTAQKPDHPQVQGFPPAIFTAGFVLGLALHLVHPLRLRSGRVPGFLLLGAGLCLGAWAVGTMRSAGTSIHPHSPATAMVRGGPFAFTRNPIYTGMTLVYTGLALVLRFAWPLAVLPWVLTSIRYGVIGREEAYLERKFGPEYHEYRQSVRRWL